MKSRSASDRRHRGRPGPWRRDVTPNRASAVIATMPRLRGACGKPTRSWSTPTSSRVQIDGHPWPLPLVDRLQRIQRNKSMARSKRRVGLASVRHRSRRRMAGLRRPGLAGLASPAGFAPYGRRRIGVRSARHGQGQHPDGVHRWRGRHHRPADPRAAGQPAACRGPIHRARAPQGPRGAPRDDGRGRPGGALPAGRRGEGKRGAGRLARRRCAARCWMPAPPTG